MPGLDLDVFVHPSHISKNFICPITQTVFDKPVVTPCEHTFCEDALLEWLSRGNESCPVCSRKVDAREVKKASRIVLNLLGELPRYCDHRSKGCNWQGAIDHYQSHLASCEWKEELSTKEMRKQLEELKSTNKTLKEENELLNLRCIELTLTNDSLTELQSSNKVIQKLSESQTEVATLRKKLQVLELSLDPRQPTSFFQPYSSSPYSTSESEFENASNTDNDGDVSSVDLTRRRRTGRKAKREKGSKLKVLHEKEKDKDGGNERKHRIMSGGHDRIDKIDKTCKP
ncbi:hypothetical protein TrVE_jg4817 [Triparma verrucosa]|uniref:RING-type domain-containing protein n=1 Tax=Triparma verrucosa TaxID=1606542 RepID=A0A9W7F049_9STRA|nr:hypothetical protein TrVE_jg4817 [Triparma verrucosa]